MRYIRLWKLLPGTAVVIAATAGRAAAQQDTTARDSVPQTVEERLGQLDQEVRVLKRLREIAADSTAAANKDKPAATAGKDGFSIKSADGKYAVRLKGLLQIDGRFFPSDAANPVVNTFFLRRARPILEATVGKYFEFRVQPDFGQGTTVLFDAYSDIKLDPAFFVRAGKFKPPVGLERLQGASDIVFVERGLPTNLVPNRDVGLQFAGDVKGGAVSYAVGVFNGVVDLGNGDGDTGDAKDFDARLFFQPFRTGSLQGLGFGAGGSTGIERGTAAAPALASYRTPGQQTFFRYRSDAANAANTAFANGRRNRLTPQAYFYTGPLGLLGEYNISWQEVTRGTTTAKLQHTGWQAVGTFLVSGDKATFKSVTPKKPFDLKNPAGRRSRCSTSPTTRPASSTRPSTRNSPHSGRPRPARM